MAPRSPTLLQRLAAAYLAYEQKPTKENELRIFKLLNKISCKK